MRNATVVIQDKELPVVVYKTQLGSESFFLNNVKKPEMFFSHGIFRLYQDDYTNRLPLVVGNSQEGNILDNEYVKYYLSGVNVNYNQYISNFKQSPLTYIEIKCTYTNPATSLYYFTPSVTGFGNKINYCPQDNFNLFLCLSTATSIEFLFDEYKAYIPLTLSYSISTYRVNYPSVSSISVNFKTTNSQTVSAFSLSANETRSIISNTSNFAYSITYLGTFPPLCATLISVLKSFK